MRFKFNLEWDKENIGNLIEKTGKKAKNHELNYIPYSITNIDGFIIQADNWDGGSYVQASKEGYKVIYNNEIAYNPARINVGSIGYFDKNVGIISSLYVCFKTKNKLLSKYLYHFMKSNTFRKIVMKRQEGGVRDYFFYENLCGVKISYPIIEEQEKIVSFLELINQRISTQKKIIGDLESLKNKINTDIYNKIDFNKKNKLKELCSITTGKLDANAMVANGKYRFYTCAENFYYINNYDFDGEALLISGNGANVGYIHYYNGKFNAYQRTYVLQNFKLNAKYVNIFLNVFLKHRIEQQKNNGNTPYIKMATLAEMTILIPSIEEQNNIISINDSLNEKISNEKKILSLYEKQKQYLLSKLFI